MGDVFTIMSKGEEFIDPETGISLGSSDSELASVRVDQAQEKFSIAEIVSMNGQVKRGDKVVSTATRPSIEYASKWQKPRRGKL